MKVVFEHKTSPSLGFSWTACQVPGPFTSAQATAGHAAYLENCASCHNRTLQGGGEAPSLIGSALHRSRTGQAVYVFALPKQH
jgi:mono/diheme cytochrome c family protein